MYVGKIAWICDLVWTISNMLGLYHNECIITYNALVAVCKTATSVL